MSAVLHDYKDLHNNESSVFTRKKVFTWSTVKLKQYFVVTGVFALNTVWTLILSLLSRQRQYSRCLRVILK